MTDATTDTTTEETTAPESGEQLVVTPLQLNDLLLTAQVIQLASSRGAFRAEELTEVGGLYDRIVAFLKESGAIAPAAPTEAPAESAE
jgi:hypothetical protein